MRNKTNPKYAEDLSAGRHRVGDAEARPSGAHHYQKLFYFLVMMTKDFQTSRNYSSIADT